MIVIEAGGSTTQVCQILQGKASPIQSHSGISPTYMPRTEIIASLRDILEHQEADAVLVYYGTGCRQSSAKQLIRDCILEIQDFNRIEIASDLLAAARVTANEKSGQINILGTGAASCLYENNTIKKVYFNSGYLFGDYGSGFQIGQSFLKAYFENRLPSAIEATIQEFSGLSKQNLVKEIYSHHSTKQYIANFTRCMHRMKQEPYIREILQNSFSKFIQFQIQLNPEYKKSSQYFVGSIAHFFKDELSYAMKASDLEINDICRSPIEKLIEYHLT